MAYDAQQPDDNAEIHTGWVNPPTLAELKADFTDSKSFHDEQDTKITVYRDNLNATGSAAIKARKGKSRVVPKLIRKQAEWRYPALSEPFLANDDIFEVRPVTWEDRDAAKQNQLVLNNQFNTQINRTDFIDEYVRTAVDEGTVIVQVGWDFEEAEVEIPVPDMELQPDPSLAPLHQQLEQMRTESPSQYETDVPEELKIAHEASMQSGIPMRPIVTGSHMEKQMKTIRNMPTVEVRDTRNTYIDPTCGGNIDKARFVVCSFESSISELKKQSNRYKNLDKINLSNSSILAASDHEVSEGSADFNFKDKPRQKFVVYEYWGYWDIEGNQTVKPIVVAWAGNTLIRMEESPFPDKKLPFVLRHYLPARKAVYGEPDGALLEDNQKVAGAVTRGMIDILGRSANGQVGIRKDMLDVTNRRKFEQGDDYEFNPNVDPRVGVFMHTYPQIPDSAQYMLNLQNIEAEALTGVKSFSSNGISSASLGNVATAIRGALDAASKRELSILRRLSAGIVAIGRKIIAMNAEFLDEQEVVRVTNDEFVQIRKDDLPGNFDLRLTISTPEEDADKAQQLAFLLQTMDANTDPKLRTMVLSDICRLRKMPDLAKKIENYQPQPDPMMQQKMQLEIQLLQMQLVDKQAHAQNMQAGAELSSQKAATEEVIRADIKSGTDQKNLDFVEQESGVKQARDLQRQGAQAEAQTRMKVVEHQMNMQKEASKQNTDLLKEYIKQKRVAPRYQRSY